MLVLFTFMYVNHSLIPFVKVERAWSVRFFKKSVFPKQLRPGFHLVVAVVSNVIQGLVESIVGNAYMMHR